MVFEQIAYTIFATYVREGTYINDLFLNSLQTLSDAFYLSTNWGKRRQKWRRCIINKIFMRIQKSLWVVIEENGNKNEEDVKYARYFWEN